MPLFLRYADRSTLRQCSRAFTRLTGRRTQSSPWSSQRSLRLSGDLTSGRIAINFIDPSGGTATNRGQFKTLLTITRGEFGLLQGVRDCSYHLHPPRDLRRYARAEARRNRLSSGGPAGDRSWRDSATQTAIIAICFRSRRRSRCAARDLDLGSDQARRTGACGAQPSAMGFERN